MKYGNTICGSVVLIGWRCAKTSAPFLIGTGFLLHDKEQKKNVSVVTARHVIEAITSRSSTGSAEVWFNVANRKVRQTIPIGDWCFHQNDRVDLAIAPFFGYLLSLSVARAATNNPELSSAGEEFKLQQTVIHTDIFVNEEVMTQYDVLPGKRVVYPGLFLRPDLPPERFVPVLRNGHIAAIPESPIETQLGMNNMILVDSRSIGGFSGAPVFTINQTQTLKRNNSFHLLGVNHGHFDTTSRQFTGLDTLLFRSTEKLNTGISLVTPASQLKELYDHWESPFQNSVDYSIFSDPLEILAEHPQVGNK